jgi:hypothetical protein
VAYRAAAREYARAGIARCGRRRRGLRLCGETRRDRPNYDAERCGYCTCTHQNRVLLLVNGHAQNDGHRAGV